MHAAMVVLSLGAPGLQHLVAFKILAENANYAIRLLLLDNPAVPGDRSSCSETRISDPDRCTAMPLIHTADADPGM